MLTPDTDELAMAWDAAVPGEVHLDLVRAGVIDEPTTGLNALRARWVEECYWFYRRTFELSCDEAVQPAELVFEGLTLAAIVYLNGPAVGRHMNSFYPCRLDVSGKLKCGENALVLRLDSGLFDTVDKPITGYGVSPDTVLTKRNWLRIPQCSCGWDWSPRLMNVGVTGSVHLDLAPAVRVTGTAVLSSLSEDLGSGTLTARVFAQGVTDAPVPCRLQVRMAEAGLETAVDVTVAPGENRLETVVTVPSPELWWPVNHGSQHLYTVEIVLVTADSGTELARVTRQVGFRHVRVNQDPHPEAGSFFVVEVNHRPIFVKGGNFVPADIIPARLDRERYATLVDRALEANFNLLRIWGGGLYESDAFYEECDRRGVLVWQEFIFACAKYPAQDERFLADIKREATYQVRRLAHHPSLVVWCGNNEMEWGNHSWGYQSGVALPDYAIFHMVLPIILRTEDGTRYYQASSPLSPDNLDPNRDDMGDQHPWSIGFLDTDFRKYRDMICRFPNEGGILGPNALPTVRACLEAGEGGRRDFAFQVHDNSIASLSDHCATDAMVEQWLGRRVPDMPLEDYVYYAGLVQGRGLYEYIRNFRRRMFDSASAVFWMYNDTWPTTRSWTVIDYYLRRTPAFYPVRRACRPLTVALAETEAGITVFAVNEGVAWEGTLHLGFARLAGGCAHEQTLEIQVPAGASTPVASLDRGQWEALGLTQAVAFARLLERGGSGDEVARDVLVLPFLREMAWAPAPQVRVTLDGGQAVFESSVFVLGVCLDLDGDRAYPDNFFDLLPGVPTVLPWSDRLGAPQVLRTANPQ
jgi:beta-mannosidase